VRLSSGPDAPRVAREAVLRHWLDRELCKYDESLPTAEMGETALLEALMARTTGENRPLWRPRETTWYHDTVDERPLRRLRTVAAPESLGWHRVAPDGRMWTAAERIQDGTVTDDDTPLVDVAAICRIADALPARDLDDIVLVGGQTTTAPRAVDGNHRAVGAALHVLDGGAMPELAAYVGVVRTRPLALLVEKARWLARGGRRGAWW
jgi:hypothetical protein